MNEYVYVYDNLLEMYIELQTYLQITIPMPPLLLQFVCLTFISTRNQDYR